jgi:hypothetical protein
METNAPFDMSRERAYAEGLLPCDDLGMRARSLLLPFSAPSKPENWDRPQAYPLSAERNLGEIDEVPVR